MNLLHATHLAHLAIILSQLYYSLATGQEQNIRQIQLSQSQPHQHPQEEITSFFVGSLMLMNEGTIKMSEFAAEKSSNDEIVAFAKKLSEGHKDLNEKLQALAPQIAQMLEIGKKEYATGFRGTNSGKTFSDNSSLGKVLKIQKRASEIYQQSSNKMIESYEGQDFDMAFLGMQIGAHTWAMAELKAMESVGSPHFQQIVEDSKSKIQQHLEEAQRLSNKFEDDK